MNKDHARFQISSRLLAGRSHVTRPKSYSLVGTLRSRGCFKCYTICTWLTKEFTRDIFLDFVMTSQRFFWPRTFGLAIMLNPSLGNTHENLQTIGTNDRSGSMFFFHFPPPTARKWPSPCTKKKFFLLLINKLFWYFEDRPKKLLFLNTITRNIIHNFHHYVDKIIETKSKKMDESITLLERDGWHMVNNEPTTYDNGGNTHLCAPIYRLLDQQRILATLSPIVLSN